jgi:methionyl-tRNA formyltransferase
MTPAVPWRVAFVTRILPVVLGVFRSLRVAGLEPVGLLTIRDNDGRYGGFDLGGMLGELPAELDTGPILAQKALPVGELCEPEEFYGRMGPVVGEVLGDALARLAAGVGGTVQEGGDYQSFFDDSDAFLDFSRPAAEVHRLVWAWRFTIPAGELHGALVELDGETVRVLASSLTEVENARRVECADAPLWLVKTEPVPPRQPAPN